MKEKETPIRRQVRGNKTTGDLKGKCCFIHSLSDIRFLHSKPTEQTRLFLNPHVTLHLHFFSIAL